MYCDFLERLHLEQQGAVKMKCWRRNKTQKKSPDAKQQTSNRKLTSNVLLESLSMLDLPTSSTSDSLPSSSTSPVLSDVNMRVNQEIIPSIENLKQLMKTSRGVKSQKFPAQTMQTTDNAVELNVECCPTLMDQNSSDASQLFTIPVSNNVSMVTTSNNPVITASNVTSQLIVSNIGSSQSVVSNVSSQSIASQSFTCKSINQPIVSKMTCQSMAACNILGSQSIANTSLKVVNTQTIASSGQVINIPQSISNSQQSTLVNSNKMVVNSIASNVCISFCAIF